MILHCKKMNATNLFDASTTWFCRPLLVLPTKMNSTSSSLETHPASHTSCRQIYSWTGLATGKCAPSFGSIRVWPTTSTTSSGTNIWHCKFVQYIFKPCDLLLILCRLKGKYSSTIGFLISCQAPTVHPSMSSLLRLRALTHSQIRAQNCTNIISLTWVFMLKVGPLHPDLTKHSYESYMSTRLCEISCFHVFLGLCVSVQKL